MAWSKNSLEEGFLMPGGKLILVWLPKLELLGNILNTIDPWDTPWEFAEYMSLLTVFPFFFLHDCQVLFPLSSESSSQHLPSLLCPKPHLDLWLPTIPMGRDVNLALGELSGTSKWLHPKLDRGEYWLPHLIHYTGFLGRDELSCDRNRLMLTIISPTWASVA